MARKVLVGMLLLGALFIFGLSTFYIENWQYYLGKGYRLRVVFPEAQTLDKGDIVRMAGVPVGTVESLEIDTKTATQDPVKAVLWIRSDVKVRADDTATIRLSSVFGGNFVAIERGDPEARELADGERIPKTFVTPSITEVVEQSKVTLSEVADAFEQITEITGGLSEGEGTLGRLLKDEELFAKLERIVENMNEVGDTLQLAAERIEAGEGVLGKLVMDDEMAENARAFAEDARQVGDKMKAIADDLDAGKGTIGKLLKEDDLYNTVNDSFQVIGDAAEALKDGEGVLPRLLDDSDMAEDLRSFLADMSEIAKKMAAGESAAGKLLASDEAYQQLMDSLANIKDITQSVRDGEGTLGKLVKDEQAYQQVSDILTTIQGMLDTYREQSPVISFAGAIFGAF